MILTMTQRQWELLHLGYPVALTIKLPDGRVTTHEIHPPKGVKRGTPNDGRSSR